MNETTITLRGRLTSDPELRFTPSGAAVANLTIATNARNYDKATGEWKDGPTSFHRCNIWRDAAENVTESLKKGDAVIAVGVLSQREYETKEGEKRQAWEVTLDAIGPDLRWCTAKPVKAQRGTSGGFGGVPAATDPWATSTTPQQPARPAAGGWGQAATDEPPFAFLPNSPVA